MIEVVVVYAGKWWYCILGLGLAVIGTLPVQFHLNRNLHQLSQIQL